MSSGKENIEKIISVVYKNLFSIFSAFILINNLIYINNGIFLQKISFEEARFMHTAWNSSNGLLVYRDFFDHHGPLYTFLSGLVLNLLKVPESFDSYLVLRQISFVFLCLTVVVIFLIALKISKSVNVASISAAVFSMWDVLQVHSFEQRPDALLNFFAAFSVLLLFKYLEEEKNDYAIVSGVLLALSILCDFHAVIVLIGFFVIALMELVMNKDLKLFRFFSFSLLGLGIVLILISTYFLVSGSFKEFIYFFTSYNHDYTLVDHWSADEAKRQGYDFFFKKDLVLTILFAVSIFSLNNQLKENRFLVALTLVLTTGSFLGLFPNYSMIFLPYASILIAIFVAKIFLTNFYEKQYFPYAQLFALVFFVLVFGAFSNNFPDLTTERENGLIADRKQMDWVLSHYNRSEKMSILKFACPASAFNTDFRYWWVTGPHEGKKSKLNLGGEPLVEDLQKYKIKLFFAYPWELEWQPDVLKKYITENYKQVMIEPVASQNCIWIRNIDSE